MAVAQGLGIVHDGQLLQVCLFLLPRDAARVQSTSKAGALAKTAASETLWVAYAARVFGLRGAAARAGPEGEDPGDPRRCFALWHTAAREVGLQGAIALEQLPPARWVAVWRRLRRWLCRYAGEVERTLQPPVRPESLALLQELGFPEPAPAVIGLWQVFDGQETPIEHSRGLADELHMPSLSEEDSRWNGLFGGYSAYDHEVSTVLLPLRSAIALTRFLQDRIRPLHEQHPNKLAFACSFNFNKILLVDLCDGSVHAWTRRPVPLLEPASPQQLAADSVLEPLPADGLLRWVEEFARRLHVGVYPVASLRPELETSMKGICLIPASGPDVTKCVTRGVEVTAGCVYMPEHPQGWTYSIAFQLVGTPAERGFESCQLHMRHWEIQEGDHRPEHVRGEGVVGLFPILSDGGWVLNRESDPHSQYGNREGFMSGPFRYQSCSGRRACMRGSFGGDITFVPGTLRRPAGEPFQVRLEPFRLYVPPYIY